MANTVKVVVEISKEDYKRLKSDLWIGFSGYDDAIENVTLLSEDKGEWIEDEDIDASDDGRLAVKCSRCSEYNGYCKTNFCPNCGADMRGSE